MRIKVHRSALKAATHERNKATCVGREKKKSRNISKKKKITESERNSYM